MTDGKEEAHMTENSSLEEARHAVRRKIDFMDVESDFGPTELDVPVHVGDLSGVVLGGVLSGDIDQGLGDLDNLIMDVIVYHTQLMILPLFHHVQTQTYIQQLML